MKNNTEKILSAFSQTFFYKELVQDNLQFTPEGSTEKELADLLLNIGDIIIAIQLKARNESSQTYDIEKENKWLGKQCKEAKKQVKESIAHIQGSVLPAFKNARMQPIAVNKDAHIIPLIIFMNEEIKEYPHILLRHSEEGMNINCMSYADFQTMCQVLLTPMEIADYLEWRLNFYEHNGSVGFLINEDSRGNISISRPQSHETLVYQFLSENYDVRGALKMEPFVYGFQNFLHSLPEHTVIKSVEDADYQIMLFLAHFDRLRIKYFIERLEKAREAAFDGNYTCCDKYNIAGSIRDPERGYVVTFVATRDGDPIPVEALIEIAERAAGPIKKLLEVYVYVETENDYRIDFLYYNNE